MCNTDGNLAALAEYEARIEQAEQNEAMAEEASQEELDVIRQALSNIKEILKDREVKLTAWEFVKDLL